VTSQTLAQPSAPAETSRLVDSHSTPATEAACAFWQSSQRGEKGVVSGGQNTAAEGRRTDRDLDVAHRPGDAPDKDVGVEARRGAVLAVSRPAEGGDPAGVRRPAARDLNRLGPDIKHLDLAARLAGGEQAAVRAEGERVDWVARILELDLGRLGDRGRRDGVDVDLVGLEADGE
jgi:hypothetical protein